MSPHSNDETQKITFPPGFVEAVRALIPQGTDLNLDSALRRVRPVTVFSILQQKITQNVPAYEVAWGFSLLLNEQKSARGEQPAEQYDEQTQARRQRLLNHYSRIAEFTRLIQVLTEHFPELTGKSIRR